MGKPAAVSNTDDQMWHVARGPASLDVAEALAALRHVALAQRDRDALAVVVAELDRSRQRERQARTVEDESATPYANRRAFLRELSRQIAIVRRHGSAYSLLRIDIDGMKRVNDRHGRAAGDAVLQHIGHILLDQVRHEDLVGRLGGDEFGVLLIGADQRAAEAKAASLQAVIADRPFAWNRIPISLTVSVGAHAFSGDESVGEILDSADLAMDRSTPERRTTRHLVAVE